MSIGITFRKLTEELTRNKYGEMLPDNFPPPVKELLPKNPSDERRHLEYFVNNLKVMS